MEAKHSNIAEILIEAKQNDIAEISIEENQSGITEIPNEAEQSDITEIPIAAKQTSNIAEIPIEQDIWELEVPKTKFMKWKLHWHSW